MPFTPLKPQPSGGSNINGTRLNVSGSATLNFSVNTVQFLTLQANTSLTFTGAVDFQKLVVQLKQDSTGSRTVTWDSQVLWSNNTTPVLTTTPNSVDIFTFIYDSTAGKYRGAATMNFSS